MTSLSTHVLDVERGTPAAGLRVNLYVGDQLLASAETDADGRISDLGLGRLAEGTYRLVFDVQTYLAAQTHFASFIQRVTVEFRVDGSQAHYHVPLLVTAYAATVYRGA